MALVVNHEGLVDVSLEGRRMAVREGQGVVVTGPSLARVSAADGAQSAVIDTPSVALSAAPIPHRSLLLIESRGVVHPVSAFVRALLMRGHVVPHDTVTHLESALVAMADAAITSSATEKVAASSSLDRAMSVIERRYTDAALSAQAIADHLNVSLRQLEREFTVLGRTIRQEIRRVRVLKALALLRDPATAGLSVTCIAEQVGFSNGSSLARAMAAEGLASPRLHRDVGAGSGRADSDTRHDAI
ncbi:helix-turn-helix domain-containing protein [Microbacterium sp. NPDC089698]|uniref:helix-turn-helix transcriptional regulator n=1 Tax=Microbacterium sp. NPDC089698 TaxID=3364200 RepID=UPI003802420B